MGPFKFHGFFVLSRAEADPYFQVPYMDVNVQEVASLTPTESSTKTAGKNPLSDEARTTASYSSGT